MTVTSLWTPFWLDEIKTNKEVKFFNAIPTKFKSNQGRDTVQTLFFIHDVGQQTGARPKLFSQQHQRLKKGKKNKNVLSRT